MGTSCRPAGAVRASSTAAVCGFLLLPHHSDVLNMDSRSTATSHQDHPRPGSLHLCPSIFRIPLPPLLFWRWPGRRGLLCRGSAVGVPLRHRFLELNPMALFCASKAHARAPWRSLSAVCRERGCVVCIKKNLSRLSAGERCVCVAMCVYKNLSRADYPTREGVSRKTLSGTTSKG